MGAGAQPSMSVRRSADLALAAVGQDELRLLGTFRFWRDSRLLLPPPSGQRLLAYLALRGAVPRSQAAGALWPDVSQPRANSNLRTVLWRLQNHSVCAVSSSGTTIWLDESTKVDYWLFERWARTILSSPAAAGPIEPPAVPVGTLVPDWDDEWLTEPRETARMLSVQAFELLAARLLAAGQPAAALSYVLPVAQLEPLRESAVRLMIAAHLRQGNVTDALALYQRYRAYLRTELGLEPSGALTSLMARHAPPGWPSRQARRAR